MSACPSPPPPPADKAGMAWCEGHTQKGEPCKRYALPGEAFCRKDLALFKASASGQSNAAPRSAAELPEPTFSVAELLRVVEPTAAAAVTSVTRAIPCAECKASRKGHCATERAMQRCLWHPHGAKKKGAAAAAAVRASGRPSAPPSEVDRPVPPSPPAAAAVGASGAAQGREGALAAVAAAKRKPRAEGSQGPRCEGHTQKGTPCRRYALPGEVLCRKDLELFKASAAGWASAPPSEAARSEPASSDAEEADDASDDGTVRWSMSPQPEASDAEEAQASGSGSEDEGEVPPATEVVDGFEEYVVEQITDVRIRHGHEEWFVVWKGYDAAQGTWESYDAINTGGICEPWCKFEAERLDL